MIDEAKRFTPSRRSLLGAILWGLGIAASGAIFQTLASRVINVVHYEAVSIDAPGSWRSFVALAAFLVIVVWFAVRHRRCGIGRSTGDAVAGAVDGPGVTLEHSRELCSGAAGGHWRSVSVSPRGLKPAARYTKTDSALARAGLPLLMTIAVAAMWVGGQSPSFGGMCVAVLGVGWSIDRLGQSLFWGSVGVHPRRCAAHKGRRYIITGNALAPFFLVAAIVASTVWHTLQQYNFWQHFLLGYADFGFFTTELEHCLPAKEVGSFRFADTRMGYHCIPMFYLLAPFYALARTPVFLMVIGPLALNLAAIPFYQLAKQRSGSSTVGLIVAFAWLLLPSITRLPYSNTYGFQSIYLAVPWLAQCFSLALRDRWRWSWVCLAAALLCEETVCGVAFGWGLYLLLWGERRRAGIVTMAVALGYLVLCTTLIIPQFASSAQYTRLQLFGDLSLVGAIERLARPRVLLYLTALAAPLLPGLWRSHRLLAAALPTLFLVVLLQQTDYLNIKYWHQSSVLPVLFAAATLGVTRRNPSPMRLADPPAPPIGPPIALLLTVLIFHQWMGTSPIAQAQRVYAADVRLAAPDPRMAAVEYVRSHFAPEKTVVIATERMAAHFTDYRMVFPAAEARLMDTRKAAYLLVFDRSDRWDKIVMEQQAGPFLAQASEAGFRAVEEIGAVLILSNFGRDSTSSR